MWIWSWSLGVGHGSELPAQRSKFHDGERMTISTPQGLRTLRRAAAVEIAKALGQIFSLHVSQTGTNSELRQVTAIDLYPTPELPDDQPDNLECEVWDLNEALVPSYKPNTYDLVHSRFVAPGIKKHRWPGYVRDICRLLRPGGWVQMVEFYYIIQSDSGLLTDDHALTHWSNGYRYSMDGDRDPRAGRNLGQLMRNAGLADIEEVTYRLPIGGWSTGGYCFWSFSSLPNVWSFQADYAWLLILPGFSGRFLTYNHCFFC